MSIGKLHALFSNLLEHIFLLSLKSGDFLKPVKESHLVV